MTARIGGLGWWCGVAPRSNLSMMIMRPPQQGQECFSVSNSAALVVIALMASTGIIGGMSSCPLLLDFGAMPTNPFGRLALARRTHGTAGLALAGVPCAHRGPWRVPCHYARPHRIPATLEHCAAPSAAKAPGRRVFLRRAWSPSVRAKLHRSYRCPANDFGGS